MDQQPSSRVIAGIRDPQISHPRRRWLTVVRSVWLLLFALNLIWFAMALAVQVAAIQHPCAHPTCPITAAQAQSLSRLGISLGTIAVDTVGIPLVALLAGSVVALLLFLRRSDDWFALLVGLFLLYPGTSFASGPNITVGVGAELLALLLGLVNAIVTYTVLITFPDGRFAPRWTWLLLVGWTVFQGVETVPSLAGILPHWHVAASVFTLLNALNFATYPLLYLSVIAIQVYRYRRVSTARQRQQTKWVVLGVVVTLSANIMYWIVVPSVVLIAVPGILQWTWLYLLAGHPLYQLATIALPITFFIAIQRHQLFDVDKLINRTLVYGSLTVILAAIYAAAVYTAQVVGGRLTGLSTPPPWVIVIVTLLVAALFNPLRQRIQGLIDRRFYRSRYDAARTVEAFAATLRTELDLSELSTHLVGVVQETMQPAHVSLWLRAQEEVNHEPDISRGATG
jgi:hypothetical protein